MSEYNYNEITPTWSDMQLYGPGSKHRRRLILKLIKSLSFDTCLDVGCAQGYLAGEIEKLGKSVSGCDISEPVIIKTMNNGGGGGRFFIADISRGFVHDKQYDLVVCSEVLEHIDACDTAVANLCRLSKEYVLITVPCGKLYELDRLLGHIQLPSEQTLRTLLSENGFNVVSSRRWGFPFYTLFKRIIDLSGASRIYSGFTGSYGIMQKMVSAMLFVLFFINDLDSRRGCQLILLAKRAQDDKD